MSSLLLCTYLLFETLKMPEDREFGALIDLLPESCRNFPVLWDESQIRYLRGSNFE